MEIKAWIGNLGRYNEGVLMGEWCDFPIEEEDFDEFLKEKVGINEHYEEWFVADYESELPLASRLGEYPGYDTLNELAERVDALSPNEQEAFAGVYDYLFSSWDEALECIENGDWRIWHGCNDMGAVACQYVEETGMFDNVPDIVTSYFDYDAYGRDMNIEGSFVWTSEGMLEVW